MGELESWHDVADRPHVIHACAQALVGCHEAAIEGHPVLFESESCRRRPTADGDEEVVRLEHGAVFEGDRHGVVGLGRAGEAHAQRVRDPTLAERALERLAHCDVLVRDEVLESFDDGHVRAERAPHARELDSDDPAPEDDDALRDLGELESVLTGEDPPADLETGQRPAVGPGRQHDVGASVEILADADRGARFENALAGHDGDAARLDETLEPLVFLGDDALAVCPHAVWVDPVQRRADADGRGIPCHVRDLGGVQQRLRRNAAAVQARAADLVLLDHGDGLAQLGGAESCRVSAAATSEYDEVELLLGHRVSSPATKRMSDRTVAPVGPLSVNP